MNIVHIGLGKCITTLLQQEIFPNFKEYKKNYDYEDIVDIICNPKSDYSFVKKVKSGFYSHESLHGWNPLLWDRSSDIVKQLFGADSTIVITVREPESYLNSIYLQAVSTNYPIKPEEYFVTNSDFKNYNNVDCDRCFSIKMYSLKRIISIYKSKFNKVYVVPFERIPSLKFLAHIFNLSEEKRKFLEEKVIHRKKINQSISFVSLKLIFMANKTLTFFGISQRKKSYFYKFFLKRFIIHFVEKFFSAKRFAFNLDADMLKEINEEKDYYNFLLEKSYKKGYLIFEK